MSNRPNLTVLTRCLVRRVLLENGRAVGIEYECDGQARRIHADAEVILSAGSIGSPHLLMLSGIGDADELQSRGVSPECHLPSVGRNLQDHLAITIKMRTRLTESYGLSVRTLPRALGIAAQYLFRSSGPLASNVFEAHGFVRTTSALDRPDIQLIFIPAHRNVSGFPIPFGHGYGINIALMRPKSRGSVSLASSDPRRPPLIDPRFLESPADLAPLMRGFEIAREILNARAFDACAANEIAPGPDVRNERDVGRYLRQSAFTVFHPVGTCRMGGDHDSVVDPQLRVRGVAGLRVADASIFPTIVGGNTNAAVIMVAEKAADLVLGGSSAISRSGPR